MTTDELKREALQLNPSSRANLARELLVGLDDLPEPAVERLWPAETVRRDEEMASGAVSLIPMDEVFSDASHSGVSGRPGHHPDARRDMRVGADFNDPERPR